MSRALFARAKSQDRRSKEIVPREIHSREKPSAGGHLNMTKPVLISQTSKRGPTVTPLNRGVGRMRITRPRQVGRR